MTAAFATKPALSGLAFLIDQALPQTQCTRCGYPDCASYARAIAAGEAPINQCPPGGQEGVQRLAALTGQPAQPLNPQFGIEGPLTVARIDEAWCIGCTMCIKACPVDCIELDVVTPHASGWQAWNPQQAAQARQRYTQHQARLSAAAPTASATSTTHDEKSAKASAIAQALAKARALRQPRA